MIKDQGRNQPAKITKRRQLKHVRLLLRLGLAGNPTRYDKKPVKYFKTKIVRIFRDNHVTITRLCVKMLPRQIINEYSFMIC
jgi:hypothetical protein